MKSTSAIAKMKEKLNKQSTVTLGLHQHRGKCH